MYSLALRDMNELADWHTPRPAPAAEGSFRNATQTSHYKEWGGPAHWSARCAYLRPPNPTPPPTKNATHKAFAASTLTPRGRSAPLHSRSTLGFSFVPVATRSALSRWYAKTIPTGDRSTPPKIAGARQSTNYRKNNRPPP